MKVRAIVVFVLLALGVSSMSGCVSHKRKGSTSKVGAVADDRLIQAAEEIRREMRRINQISAPSTPPSQVRREPSVPRDFMRIASVDYDGDIEVFLRDLRDSGLYDVRIYGRRPVTDLPVSLHLRRQPIWRVLEDAGIQLGRFATIAIKPGVVIVNYVNYNQ